MILRHVIDLQAGWIARPGGGEVRARRFGRPPDMPAGERLVLVVEPAPGASRRGAASVTAISLNGRPFDDLPRAESRRAGAEEAGRIARDVTAALAPRNELEIVAAFGTAADASPGATHLPLPDEIARVWIEVLAPPHDGERDDHP